RVLTRTWKLRTGGSSKRFSSISRKFPAFTALNVSTRPRAEALVSPFQFFSYTFHTLLFCWPGGPSQRRCCAGSFDRLYFGRVPRTAHVRTASRVPDKLEVRSTN